MKKILVTGANGFVGHHLVRGLKDQGHEIVGVGREDNPSPILTPLLSGYVTCDLASAEQVRAVISFEDISAVIHLAGLANVGQSFREPATFLSLNAAMSINILETALARQATSTRFVVISSGAVYDTYQPMPIAEDGLLAHNSPYAISKIAVEYFSDYYSSRGLDVVTMRPFNHFGPGQARGFIVPDLIAKLRDFQENGTEITVGNLATRRDYTDVRDVARAYSLVALGDTKPKHAVYNVCSGMSRSGEEILHALSEAMGIQSPQIHTDEALLRPNDAMDIVGNNHRLREEFGWGPKLSFEQTIHEVVASSQ